MFIFGLLMPYQMCQLNADSTTMQCVSCDLLKKKLQPTRPLINCEWDVYWPKEDIVKPGFCQFCQ